MTDTVCCDKWDAAKKSSILFDIKLTEEKIEREKKVYNNAVEAAQFQNEYVTKLKNGSELPRLLSEYRSGSIAKEEYESRKKEISSRLDQQCKILKFRIYNVGNLCLELDSYEKRLKSLKQQIAE
jgi:hypothetical protein